jgi:GT2 family glycosyltransferase
VVLHYSTIDDTKECVESICSFCKSDNFHIIIVDNASPNDTGNKLESLYSESDKITVILNEENLGFARGNNVGFLYAKKKLEPEFIILINNDTAMIQRSFCSNIETCYRETDFAVMGPMILSADGKYVSNPINENFIDKDEVVNRINFVRRRIFALKWHLDKLLQMRNMLQRANYEKDASQYFIRKQSVRLHGSCLIFSRNYIDKFDGLDERTFMYEEERFLQKRLQDNHLVSVYDPETLIYHKEGSSTEKSHKSDRKKQLFYLTNDLKSLEILLSDF